MKKVLLVFWPSVMKHKVSLVLVLLGLTLGIALDAIHPYLIRELVDVFTSSGSSTDAKQVFVYLVLLVVLTRISWSAFGYVIPIFEARVMRDLDQRCFEVLQMQAVRFFENSFSGSLVKQVTRFRYAFEGIADAFFWQIGRNVLLISLVLVIFFVEMPMLALAFLIWIIFFIGMNILLSLWKYPLDMANATADSAVSGALADSLSNHTTVKSYGMERCEQERFDSVVENNYLKRICAWIVSNHLSTAQSVVMAIFELFLIWVMIKGWEKGIVTVGDFVFFQSYVLWLFSNLWDFGNTLRRTFQHSADAQEMTDIFYQIPEIRDAPFAKKLTITDGAITFDHIGFSYEGPQTKRPLRGNITDLSLDITPKESVALVGESGSGKTTMIKLLMRYFDLQKGAITIDGQSIADVIQESLRQRIALVPQVPELFHRTLRENIAFARPDATEDEIITAAKQAHAWDFIQKMKKGLGTIVGERGVKLSGGERQRIALARAFLVDAPILILDEATSSLDSKTEKLIQDAIANLLKQRTSIVIAHRLSTIMQMDRIVVMEGGQIKEEGTHKDLIDMDGVYANLWAYQSGDYQK
jgi:ATP-binding cassette, subfamily B, bacterial